MSRPTERGLPARPMLSNVMAAGWKPAFRLLALLLLTACGAKAASLASVLPGADTIPGWSPTGDVETFDENLYDLVDGQADGFFAYGFEQVAVRGYENGDGARLDVEVWQLATPADAYGLFTASVAGTPVAVGNDGDSDPGRRLTFWQSRYYVQVRARLELPNAELVGFANSIVAALPAGGERPALVGQLPPEGLDARGVLFFHEEISLQSEVWLGGENILGLSQETDGVLAHYAIDGAAARLLLVQYPDAQGASAGLAALASAQVDGLVAAQAQGNLLGAVLGEADSAAAWDLLEKALIANR